MRVKHLWAALLLTGPCAATQDYILHGNGTYNAQAQSDRIMQEHRQRQADTQRQQELFNQSQQNLLLMQQNAILQRRP